VSGLFDTRNEPGNCVLSGVRHRSVGRAGAVTGSGRGREFPAELGGGWPGGAEGGDVGAGLSVADTAVVMDINKGRASQLISS